MSWRFLSELEAQKSAALFSDQLLILPRAAAAFVLDIRSRVAVGPACAGQAEACAGEALHKHGFRWQLLGMAQVYRRGFNFTSSEDLLRCEHEAHGCVSDGVAFDLVYRRMLLKESGKMAERLHNWNTLAASKSFAG